MNMLKARIISASLFVIAIATGCNSEFDKMIPDAPETNLDITYKKPKILYIIADGARGSSVRSMQPANIVKLLPKSIYSWNSLNDLSTTNAANWADLVTGVRQSKHGVASEDFAGNKLSDYPVIFQRIKSINPKLRMASFASSETFKANLTSGMDVSESFAGNDEAVKSRMVDFLKTDTAALVLGEFSGIDAAGKASGYDITFAPYRDAITEFDTRIGAIIETVKARPTYDRENWLIIITSNKGGQFTLSPALDDKTIFSNTNANTFTIFHTEETSQTFIGKPFVGTSVSGSAVNFLGAPEGVRGLVSESISRNFNFGDTSSFTISVKVKKNRNPGNISRGEYYYQWPSILGKKAKSGWGDNEGPGWDFSLLQNRWRFFISGGSDFRNGYEINGLEFSGETWHDLTAVVEYKPNKKKYVRIYTDGVLGVTNNVGVTGVGGSIPNPAAKEVELPGVPNFDNNAPLRVGWVDGQIDGAFGKIDVSLCDFRIFKKALTENVIKQYACVPLIDASHPNWQDLVGYWPMNEGSGSKLRDQGPFIADMTLSAQKSDYQYKWNSYNSLICSPNNTNLGNLVPRNVDVPAQILSWFNIARQDKWALDGKVWLAF